MHGDFSQRRRANQKIRSLAVGSVSGLCKRGGVYFPTGYESGCKLVVCCASVSLRGVCVLN